MESGRDRIHAYKNSHYSYNEIDCGSKDSSGLDLGITEQSRPDEKQHLTVHDYLVYHEAYQRHQASPSWLLRAKERWHRLRGWRFGVTLAALSTSTVLLLNIVMLITAFSLFSKDVDDGIGTAYEGHCDVVSNMATISHVFINILGTLLLSASNYTMQVLSSPTRAEVDQAHAKGDWLDIGVPSLRNVLGRISKQHIVVWWLLALTSIPIHLLFNSTSFKTLDTNNYNVVVANEDFLRGEPFRASVYNYHPNNPSLSGYASGPWANYTGFTPHARLIEIQQEFASSYHNSSIVQNLTNAECMRDYGVEYISGRSDILIISPKRDAFESVHDSFYLAFDQALSAQELTYEWICPSFWTPRQDVHCDVSKQLRDPKTWNVNGFQVEYCLSLLQKPRCKLQFSTGILITVVIMNAIKAGCMYWTLSRLRDPALATVGDAVASFLVKPDLLSENRCLMSKSSLNKVSPRWSSKEFSENIKPLPQPFETLFRRRWFAAASQRRWTFTLSLCLLALIATSVLLSHAASSVSRYTGGQSIFELGFGVVDPREVIQISLPSHGSVGLAASVLFANAPQLLVSFIYVSYNGLLTTMLLTHEWSRYYLSQKPLRVSTPKGDQRSTHWLHLPYKYSVPFLFASALLHWLVSESIFLVRVDEYKDSNLINSTSKVGFSSLPILFVILLGTIMVLVIIAIGFRKFASLMPVAGSCSAAISAACHPPPDDTNAAYSTVSWGAIEQGQYHLVGHCTFTSHKVCAVTSEHVYR